MKIMRSVTSAAGVVAIGFGILVVPFVLDSYTAFQVAQYLIFVIAVLGLNVLSGYSGQLSLGHGAFMGIGAYVAAFMMGGFGVSYILAIPAAAVACAIVGYAIGFPALRLHGHYLALATFGLALSLPQVLKYKPLEKWTGGTQGMILDRPEPPFELSILGAPIDADRWLLMLVAVVAAIVLFLTWNLLRCRVGRAFIALRDHPIAASTMGVDLAKYKAMAFAVSSSIAGAAGALLTISTGFVAPDNFHAMLSISLLVGAVIGGIATIWGAFFGGLFVQVIPEMAHELSTAAPSVVYGVVLLLIIYLMPEGLVGFVRSRVRRKAN